ncbi:zinc-binding dehydrogenase, partial [Nocardia niigatensis]
TVPGHHHVVLTDRGDPLGPMRRPRQQMPHRGVSSGLSWEPNAATSLTRRFDLVLITAGTLPVKVARTILEPGGRIISILPTPANLARSVLPGPFHAMIARPVAKDLEEVARAAGQGTLRVPISRTIPLSQAIPALTELEQNGTAKRGKLIITPG